MGCATRPERAWLRCSTGSVTRDLTGTSWRLGSSSWPSTALPRSRHVGLGWSAEARSALRLARSATMMASMPRRPNWDMDRRRRSLRDPRNFEHIDENRVAPEPARPQPEETYWVFRKQKKQTRPVPIPPLQSGSPAAPSPRPTETHTPQLARRDQLETANKLSLLDGRVHTAGEIAEFLRHKPVARGTILHPKEPRALASAAALWQANRHGYFSRTYTTDDF
jgi:hypothetical protein